MIKPLNIEVIGAQYKNNKGEFVQVQMRINLPVKLKKDMNIIKQTIKALYGSSEVYLEVKDYAEKDEQNTSDGV